MPAVAIVGPERVGAMRCVVVVMVVDAEEVLAIARFCSQVVDRHTLGRSPHCFCGTLW